MAIGEAKISKLSRRTILKSQKRHQAQDVAEVVTLAECRLGALLKEIPKSQGKRTDLGTSSTANEEVMQEEPPKTKTEVVKELGFSMDMASDFQQMADNEPIVREAIAEARENNDIISHPCCESQNW